MQIYVDGCLAPFRVVVSTPNFNGIGVASRDLNSHEYNLHGEMPHYISAGNNVCTSADQDDR